jgi:RimJ/RimL family protein N-acetyltransferase
MDRYMKLKTKKLRIIPLTTEQLKILLEGQDKLDSALGLKPCGVPLDEHMLNAVREMYELCVGNPKEYLWYTDWLIILKDENIAIGSIGFRGKPNEKREFEIGYGINEAYRGRGLATEAVKAMLDWAFSLNNAYFMQAQTEEENIASQRVLEKCGFTKKGTGTEGLLWELEKPPVNYISIYMCLGLSIGMSFGLALQNISIGMCIGIAVGIALGSSLDAQDKKSRKR